MKSMYIHLCPVCRRGVKATIWHNIPQHLDSILEDICPASGYPFRITIARAAEFLGVVA